MVRKDKSKKKISNKTSSTDKTNKAKTDIKPDITKEEEQDNFIVLIKAQTNKISPKSEGNIGFELVKDIEAILYLRLTSNSSSGNFCKTPITLNSVIDALNKQKADTAFTSKVIKDVFQGKGSRNANNRSFLMAALRSKELGLTVADKDKPMLSKLSVEFKSQSDKLLGMS